jgi:hypothetical protein
MREIFIYLFECNGMEWNGMEWNGMEWNESLRLLSDFNRKSTLPRKPAPCSTAGWGRGRGKRRGICLFRSPALQYCRGV